VSPKILVLAEHDNATLNPVTLNALAAAGLIGQSVDVLVVGQGCRPVAEVLARKGGVARVLLVEAGHLAEGGAENLAAQILAVAPGYTHIVSPATSTGKSVMPRVAAMLDVAQISEVVAIESPDVFTRPIYAGNALLSVKSLGFGKSADHSRLRVSSG
jgi:electron transfer flavoprotein alpha subunit